MIQYHESPHGGSQFFLCRVQLLAHDGAQQQMLTMCQPRGCGSVHPAPLYSNYSFVGELIHVSRGRGELIVGEHALLVNLMHRYSSSTCWLNSWPIAMYPMGIPWPNHDPRSIPGRHETDGHHPHGSNHNVKHEPQLQISCFKSFRSINQNMNHNALRWLNHENRQLNHY